MPRGLPKRTMPPNLPQFIGSRDENHADHVERFLELLTSYMVSNDGYYLIWFPTTLVEGTYA